MRLTEVSHLGAAVAQVADEVNIDNQSRLSVTSVRRKFSRGAHGHAQ
jgi:hypothetical protein